MQISTLNNENKRALAKIAEALSFIFTTFQLISKKERNHYG